MQPFSEQWEKNYCLLIKFQQREGYSNVPSSHTEDDTKLGTYLNEQQLQKEGKPDRSVGKRMEDTEVVLEVHLENGRTCITSSSNFNRKKGVHILQKST